MDKRILVALDVPSLDRAVAIATPLKDKVGFKTGLELITAVGTSAIVKEIGSDVFYDGKFHDIPNTVAGAVRAACLHEVWMLNVHCSGGKSMMQAASTAAGEVFGETGHQTLVIGVTILTSQDRKSLSAIGIDPNLSMEQIVEKLAILAQESGLDGTVCSPQEITIVRKAVQNKHFLIVTPGIRKSTDPPDDQKRTMTARQAIDLGADHLVIGRSITKAPDPVATAVQFMEEIT